MADAILVAMVFGPAVLVWLLRANGALAFLSLATGYGIVNYSINDINRLFGQLHASVKTSLISLAILLLPPLLTLFITHKGISKTHRLAHIIPALGCGGLLALTAIPLLTDSVSGNFYSSTLWHDIGKYQSPIVGVGGITSLLMIWYEAFSKPKSKKSKS